jgi:hypothetical protein
VKEVEAMTVVATSAGASAAAAAAAARKRREEEEEEKLTQYDGDDMEKYEFKIMRSSLGKFGKYETLKRVCEQEAKAGWEMVEKFDQYRVRFRRNIDNRANDRHLDFDPYRTGIGGGSGARVAIIIAISGLVALGAVLLAVFASK